MNISSSNRPDPKRMPLFIAALGIMGVCVSILFWKIDTRQQNVNRNQAKYPTRIISVSPSVTECLFALGCEDRIVGVTQFCNYPPEASSLPNLGGLINPNFERLLSLRPDIVIYQGYFNKVAGFCHSQKIKTLQVQVNDIETINSDIMVLGEKLGCQERAIEVVSQINITIENIKSRLAGMKKVKVFLCLGRLSGSMASLTTVGGDTFISEMVALAGGENIFADLSQDYAEINKEGLLERDPDVIIEVRPGEELGDDVVRSLEADWGDMGHLTAVKNGNVHILTEDYLLMPTPRLTMTLERLANVIHPEAFEDE